MAEVKLSDLASDFITPSLACVKPMQIDRAKPNRVLQLEGLQDTAMPTTATAKVTLNDCLACAGCITSAESVLVTQQSTEEFERMLGTPGAYDLIVVSLSAASRAALAAHSGIGLREAHGRLTGFLKGLGCHSIVDCGLAADLGLLQLSAEFVERFRQQQRQAQAPPLGPSQSEPQPPPTPSTPGLPQAPSSISPATTAPAPSLSAPPTALPSPLPLPLLTSSCPGWVC